jgi:hypothetical protein
MTSVTCGNMAMRVYSTPCFMEAGAMRDARDSRSTTQVVLLLAGGCAGALFIAVFSLLGAISPGYDPMREPFSALEFQPLGYLQQTNFIVFGLLQAAFAYAIRVELKGGKGDIAIPSFQLICAGAVVGDGFFIHDPAHLTFDLIAFNATMIVLCLFAWRFWEDRRWKGWPLYCVATVVGMIGCLTAFGIANQHGGFAGFFERLATALRTTWSIAFVGRLLYGGSLSLARG